MSMYISGGEKDCLWIVGEISITVKLRERVTNSKHPIKIVAYPESHCKGLLAEAILTVDRK